MSQINTTVSGRIGEDIATDFLTANHYIVLERNFRWRHLEVDLICQKDNFIVFVEVKMRSSRAFGEPYKAVSLGKQKQLIKIANAYIIANNIEKEARFDVVSIIHNKSQKELELIPNAFTP